MTKIISVSLPDELYERVQVVKESINVSGICQEALEKEIEIQELLKKGTKMSTIEKLRKQKEEHDEVYFDEGKSDGIKDAEDMDYEELLEVVKCGNGIYKTDVYYNRLKDGIEEKSNDDSAFNESMYIDGWIEGVTEFYDEIKDEL